MGGGCISTRFRRAPAGGRAVTGQRVAVFAPALIMSRAPAACASERGGGLAVSNGTVKGHGDILSRKVHFLAHVGPWATERCATPLSHRPAGVHAVDLPPESRVDR